MIILSFLFSLSLQASASPNISPNLRPAQVKFDDLIEVAFDGRQAMPTRWKALTDAARVGGYKSLAAVKRASQNSEWFMRAASLSAMEAIDAKHAHQLAGNLIQDKALVVRSAAVDVFSRGQTQAERVILWSALQDKRNFKRAQSLWIRPQIAKVLSEKVDPSERQKFAMLAHDADQKVARIANSVLSHLSASSN